MPLGLRIFLVYFLFVGLTGYFVMGTVMDEIRPGVRQSTEETLVDTANLLAEILREDMKAGTLQNSRLPALLRAYGERQPRANIWGIHKTGVNHRIYVTDANGIVQLDSAGQAVGQDYSRWNDVYLTLRGQYGARSTPEVAGDDNSTVMYVAAPIRDGERIIGVVTVAKPNSTLQPYIERSQKRLTWVGTGLVVLGLGVGGLLSWWLSRSLGQLTAYARAVSVGQRVPLPRFRAGELAQLASAVDSMRAQLEGKAYVEHYVQNLTHELKSPLAAIRGGAELLQDNIPDQQRRRFAANIEGEALRMQRLIERLLNLAQLEQRGQLEDVAEVPIGELAQQWLEIHAGRLAQAGVQVENLIDTTIKVRGERLLLAQALGNLLDNALDFTPTGGSIRLAAQLARGRVILSVFNASDPIPDFALPRLTERFYSLPRPATGRKSTGLGLNFVQEVAALHGGSLIIANRQGGVEARLELPAA